VNVRQHTVGLGVMAKGATTEGFDVVRWSLDQAGSASFSQVPTLSASANPAMNIGM
jgi:hypothetical protein